MENKKQTLQEPLIKLPTKVEKVILFSVIVVPLAFVVLAVIVVLIIDSQPAKAISCDGFYKEINTAKDGKLYIGDGGYSYGQLLYGEYYDANEILNAYSKYLSNCKLIK